MHCLSCCSRPVEVDARYRNYSRKKKCEKTIDMLESGREDACAALGLAKYRVGLRTTNMEERLDRDVRR